MAAIPRVIILGGGLAGLAAAIRLAEAGCDVEILEKRPVLGGRASSFLPPGGAEPIDNCQHVLLGCCTNLLDFFRRAGTADRFRFYNRFLFLGPGGLSAVGASSLPAPLHLLPSLVSFRDLTWRDRWAIARAMLVILRNRDTQPDETMLAWLRRQRQTPHAIEYFWRAILTSALNEDLERVSSRHALHVFWEAFLRNRRGYRMGVPTTSLGDLYSSELLKQKCRVCLTTPVAHLVVFENRIQAITLQNGAERTADFYISAIPPDALARLLPAPLLAQWPGLERLGQLEWSPITGIHLWFDRPITALEHTAIVGRTIQWLFHKSRIAGRRSESPEGPVLPALPALSGLSRAESRGAEGSEVEGSGAEGHYVQFVVSASRSLMTLRRDEIIERVLEELRELFPASRDAKLLQAVVVKEAESTISFPPGSETLRPGPETPLANLFLAGDWTATGWPPTMEGAVRSGYRAAERVMAAAGNPQQFLVPDLPTDPLARLIGSFGKLNPREPLE